MIKPWRELLNALLNRGTLREMDLTGADYPKPEAYGFLIPDQPAKDGICRYCGDGGLKIVWTKHDDKPVLYVVCHECGSHKIPESLLRQWKIIMPIFFEKLSAVFGLNHSLKPVIPKVLWLLGQKDGIEYYFLRYLDILKPIPVVNELTKSPKSVVLTTNETFADLLQQFVPQPCLALETVVTLNPDGTITADISEQLKVAFPDASVPPFEFRKKGQGWKMRFDGKESFLKEGVGPTLLSLLLSKPNIPIFASDLQAIAVGQKPEHAQRVSAGHKTDVATLEQVHKKYNELAAELEEAIRDHDSLLEQEIRSEIEKLTNYLAEATGWDGRIRKETDEAEKIRQSVWRAIQRTIIMIEEILPKFAEHLEEAISTGFVINYEPPTTIEWVL